FRRGRRRSPRRLSPHQRRWGVSSSPVVDRSGQPVRSCRTTSTSRSARGGWMMNRARLVGLVVRHGSTSAVRCVLAELTVLSPACTFNKNATAATSARVAVTHTLVAVVAHPDDETIVSPALARYAREGARVVVVVATDGRKGVAAHAHIPAGD